MKNRTIKPIILAIALLSCAAVLWWAYDSFKSRYLRPFESQTTLFDGTQLRLPAELAGPGPVRVVHLC
jgi:hypothetical protein